MKAAGKATQAEWERLLERAMLEPGVAAALDVLEKSERALQNASVPIFQHEFTAASADEAIRKQ